MESKKIEMIKKVKALANRGVGGEKEDAAKLLEKLMKKYGIEEADISEDIVFRISGVVFVLFPMGRAHEAHFLSVAQKLKE